MSGRAEGTPFWSTGWFWALLALCSIAPFVFSPLPMMPDYFSHTARYHVMNHGAASPFLPRYYAFAWQLIGNLGVDLLMVPLGRLLPTEPAAHIAAGLIPPLTIAGIHAVARAAWGRIEAPALLALPFVWSFPFLYGFVNYHLAVALALLVFALWIRGRALPLSAQYPLFAALGMAVWVSHVAGWGALLVMAGPWQLATAFERRGRIGPALVDTALRIVPLLLPAVFIVAWRNQGAGTQDLFAYDFASKLVWPFVILKSEQRAFDIACVIAIGALIAWMVLSSSSRKHPALLASAAALALAYGAMPAMLFNSAFADTRLLPVLAIVLALSVAPARPPHAKGVALFAIALFAVRLAAITAGWHERGIAAEADLKALERVPRGSRIAAFAPQSYCHPWELRGFEHLPSLATVRRDAFVNTQWDTPGAQLMHPIYNRRFGFNHAETSHLASGRCRGSSVAQVLRALPRARFDYVWVFEAPVPATPWLRLAYAGPNGRLYAIVR